MNVVAESVEIEQIVDELLAELSESDLEEGVGDFFRRAKDFGKDKLREVIDYVRSAIKWLKEALLPLRRMTRNLDEADKACKNIVETTDDIIEAAKDAEKKLAKAHALLRNPEELQKLNREKLADLESKVAELKKVAKEIRPLLDETEDAADDVDKFVTKFDRARPLQVSTVESLVSDVLAGEDADVVLEGLLSGLSRQAAKAVSGVPRGVGKTLKWAKMIAKMVLRIAKLPLDFVLRSVKTLLTILASSVVLFFMEDDLSFVMPILSTPAALAISLGVEIQDLLADFRMYVDEAKGTLEQLSLEAETLARRSMAASSTADRLQKGRV